MSTKKDKLEKVTANEFYSDASLVAGLSNDELKSHIVDKRVELAANIDALEYKMNLERQLDEAKKRFDTRLRRFKQEQPLAFAAIGVGAVVVAGLIVTAVIKGGNRR
jgi:outer membrane murein-binding lipoprotein Lpp